MYKIFHRTWWKHGEQRREPGVGKAHFIDEVETEEEARLLCKAWNASHEPGELSDKAEYEEV